MKYNLFFISLLAIVSACSPTQEKGRKPKNIILMIGDGMGTAQIYAGMTAKKGTLNLERCQYVGFHKSYSAEDYITDSAAGATAFSTGKKTYNAAIGVDTDTMAVPTILEMAEKQGLSTGLVATSAITHATPAAFIAHCMHRDSYEEIAMDFLKTDIDVFIGGGFDNFAKRNDGLDLTQNLKKQGYQVLSHIDQIKGITSGKLAGFTAPFHNPSIKEGRGEMLPIASKTAINILNNNKKGFFLMLEGSQIDWGGHQNNLQYIIDEMLDFDQTIGDVLDFAQKDGNTLVIITADHETGGLALVGGNIKEGTVEGRFSTSHHTGVMIPVFAFGPGAEEFAGIYENTAIFDKMKALLNF